MRQIKCNRALGLMIFYLMLALIAVREVGPAFAQVPFYQGKTITLIVGAGPGGMGDLRASSPW
jgi:tripartite-type tricarboxylate transporter receptor subunit TctC